MIIGTCDGVVRIIWTQDGEHRGTSVNLTEQKIEDVLQGLLREKTEFEVIIRKKS